MLLAIFKQFQSKNFAKLLVIQYLLNVMSKTLGIIGGGQLGMMLTEAAQNLDDISKIIVLDPTENCPAAKVGAQQIIADFKDEDAIKKLSELSDIITYEIESGNSDVLKKLEENTEINPSPDTLRIIQDKLLQKQFLQKNGIAVAEFEKIENKGNYKINSKSEIDDALDLFSGKTLMVEKFVKFEKEVSVIAARNTKGEIATYREDMEDIVPNNGVQWSIDFNFFI